MQDTSTSIIAAQLIKEITDKLLLCIEHARFEGNDSLIGIGIFFY